jgi:uncharacterized protein (DUF1697 family)
MPPVPYIALLRGINVSGRNQIAMPALRALCTELGWQDVQSYIQSGNLVFKADSSTLTVEQTLEQAISERFGLTIAIIVRAAADWPGYIANNPFPEESEREPNLVMLALSKALPKTDAAERIQERAANGERIVQAGGVLWIYYADGAGRSKISPGLLDRLVGSLVTTRNWRTVLKLQELTRGVEL